MLFIGYSICNSDTRTMSCSYWLAGSSADFIKAMKSVEEKEVQSPCREGKMNTITNQNPKSPKSQTAKSCKWWAEHLQFEGHSAKQSACSWLKCFPLISVFHYIKTHTHTQAEGELLIRAVLVHTHTGQNINVCQWGPCCWNSIICKWVFVL